VPLHASVRRRQIELLTTFADQAVIAIENVPLFDELRQRTEDLSESPQQQLRTDCCAVCHRGSGVLV